MKETIYTIPINDAYDQKCGCPLCLLQDDLERASVDYIMGAAMMEPDVRINTNLSGFCPKHFNMMLARQNRLSLALILESHLNELYDECFAPDTDKLSKRDFDKITERLARTACGCFVCDQIRDRMDKYYRNIVYLWRKEPDFKNKTLAQEYFCLHHLSALLEYAKNNLDKKALPDFYKHHMSATAKKLDGLKTNITKFCKSFDHRFCNMPLGDAQSAVEDAINFLSLN